MGRNFGDRVVFALMASAIVSYKFVESGEQPRRVATFCRVNFMTISMKRAAFLLSGTIAAGMYGSVSMAADVETTTALPAVSDPNGKVEIGGGWADIDDLRQR